MNKSSKIYYTMYTNNYFRSLYTAEEAKNKYYILCFER